MLKDSAPSNPASSGSVKFPIISILLSGFFIFFGNRLLLYLGISSGSFLVAGGILLFLISIEMLFGKQSEIKMHTYSSEDKEDVSVFPLAIPMLCGPGNIAALLMFSSQNSGNIKKQVILLVLSIAVFLIALAVMFFSKVLERLLGETGISIFQRIIGLILSAMSVQFFINGLRSLKVIS